MSFTDGYSVSLPTQGVVHQLVFGLHSSCGVFQEIGLNAYWVDIRRLVSHEPLGPELCPG